MPQGSAALPATCAAPREEACEGAQPSLGAISNGSANAGPYQLTHAESNTGSLDATYDVCGNMTSLSVSRPEAQCAGGTSCTAQHFEYEWDEIGRLVRAQRFDDSSPTGPPAADLRYHYDSSDNRTLKTATDALSVQSHSVYIFPSLELRGSQFGADYEVSAQTEVAYLFAKGVRLARLVNDPNGSGLDTSGVRVFFELGDHLGSTSVALDQATGELVERSTYQAYGGAESTYRPERWGSFREDYRFTGKEEDVEVGLVYFGKRFYNPLLQRWVSADPLEVHGAGEADANVYAYVAGAPVAAIDREGLDAVVLHGGGPGDRDGVRELSATVRTLMNPQLGVKNMIPEYRPNIDYASGPGLLLYNSKPQEGVRLAEQYTHQAAGPKVLAGYSVGGDAALRVGRTSAGEKWDLRVIAGARVDYQDRFPVGPNGKAMDFVTRLEEAAQNSKKVVVVAIKGDNRMANDGVLAITGSAFGDRSYEGVVASIEEKYGSLDQFYEKHNNVVIKAAEGAHAGGGNRASTQAAVAEGLQDLKSREQQAAPEPYDSE